MKLKELRKQHGIKQTELCKSLGISQSCLSAWETGTREMGSKELQQVADFFGVSVDYLLGRDDVKHEPHIKGLYPLDNYVKLPALGIIRGGDPICTDQGEYDEVYADAKFGDGNHFMLKVQGDSMYPTIPDGAWAIIERTNVAQPGQVVAFALDGEYATLKRYYPQPDGSIILKGDNPKITYEFHITQEQLNNGEAHIVGVCKHVKFDL